MTYRLFAYLSLLLAGLLLAACGTTTPSKYYTLGSIDDDLNKQKATAQAAFAIQIPYVDVPEQVDRTQILLSQPNSTEVTVLNDSLWTAPLGDEIRLALANTLSGQLQTIDLSQMKSSVAIPTWTFRVDVQGFQLVYGQFARIKASWQMTPQGLAQGIGKICQMDVKVPVKADGIEPLIAAQRTGVQTLALAMAAQVGAEKPAALPSASTQYTQALSCQSI